MISASKPIKTLKNIWQWLESKYQKDVCKPPHSIWRNPVHFIACGFGVGTFPIMPGTVGTLAAIPLIFALKASLSLLGYSVACVLLLIVGILVCDITNRDFGTQDHPAAVIDELATFPIALLGIPLTWPYVLAAFLLFRYFDIVKPGLIRWVDKHVHGGIGVMLDDVMAALATLALLHFIMWILGVAST